MRTAAFSCLLRLSWRRLSILGVFSALGQLLPCLPNGGNTWSQVQKRCCERNVGVRAVRKTLHWPPESYFVSLPITYYQGQHIVTAEGRTKGLVPWRDSVHAWKCSSLWLGWKGCAPAHSCSAWSGSRELCPAPPAPHCIRDGLIPCRGACREFMSLISPQPVHSEALQVCQGNNNSNLRILLYDFHMPVHFLNCCVDLALGF